MEDYDVAIENLADGNLDISVISPVSYVIAKNKDSNIQYISTIVRQNEGRSFATFKGYLVVNKSRFKGWTLERFLEDPKRYRLGLVTKASASGWAYPMAMFKKKGIDPEKEFASVTVFDNHPELTDAVAKGKVDLGATWEYNLEKAREKYGDVFQIIWTTPDIPGLSWVASARTDPAFVMRIREVMTEINSSETLKRELLKDTPDKGWMFLNDGFYDSVRDVMKYVGEFK
jgi:phosphonate transport system substrate-binding protein